MANNFEQNNVCRRCGNHIIRRWDDLSADEKFIIERLFPAELPPESKKHRFCTRCWYEDTGRDEKTA